MDMKPVQALALIDEGISRLQATRSDHVRLQSAISILAKLIASQEAPSKEENANQQLSESEPSKGVARLGSLREEL